MNWTTERSYLILSPCEPSSKDSTHSENQDGTEIEAHLAGVQSHGQGEM